MLGGCLSHHKRQEASKLTTLQIDTTCGSVTVSPKRDNVFTVIVIIAIHSQWSRCKIHHVFDWVRSSNITVFNVTETLLRQHNIVPEKSLVSDITHVIIAFMRSETFNNIETPSNWTLFTTVEEVRSKFPQSTYVMVAIGGWGDSGFSDAAATEKSQKNFARNVKAMLDSTGADGKLIPGVLSMP